jgi:peptidyl-prolyl cis-trans isomerase D
MYNALIFATLQKNRMAILTKIRNRSGLAIGFVGLALVLFLVSDALTSGNSIFNSNNTDVGEIDGESISIKQMEQEMAKQEAMFTERNQGQPIDENTRNQIKEQAWNTIIQQNLMSKEFAELGITVTNDELSDLFYGDNIHPQVKQSFTDPKTGSFDKNVVIQNLKQITEKGDEKTKKQLRDFEDYLYQDGMNKKYAALLKKGIYTTNLEAKKLYETRTRTAELNYIAMPFNTIADSTIKKEDSDLKSYFNKNQNKYKERENSRKLSFVVYDFAPSAQDTAEMQKWVAEQTTLFAQAKNDTQYVDQNSEVKFDPTPRSRKDYPEDIVNSLFNDSIGSIVGPIFKDNKYQIYKISGVKNDTTVYMRASHILFKVEGTGTAQDTLNSKAKAEEVLAQIKKGSDFALMAAQYGTDGTKDRGGDLGWFQDGQMVKEFNTFCKNGKKGDLGVVKTQFGWHIVKVTENKSSKLVVAGLLERTFKASDKTTQLAYNDASQFALSGRNVTDFEANAKEKKLEIRQADFVRETDNFLPGYADAREAVRWAFNAKVGDVSEVITIGDKHLILAVKEVREKGKANFDAAKTRVEADYIKDKKAEQLTAKMKEAIDGGATTLDALSKKLNLTVTPVGTQSFENANIAYVGQDNTFVGAVLGTAPAKLQAPFKGDAGVYAFMVNKFNEAPPIKDYTQYKAELKQPASQRLEYGYMEALKEMRNVVDMRYKFY